MYRTFRLVLLLSLEVGNCLGSQSTSWDDVLKAAHVRLANRILLQQTPFYTCLETITRSESKNSRAKLKAVDVVQVDVGVGANQEIYSWPGASAFSDVNLPELVGHGMLTTGMFHSFASNLFVSDHGIIRYLGEESVDGKRALHFAYTVPEMENRWLVVWLGVAGNVGQAGEFWVDPSDLSLRRLQVEGQRIPSELRLQSMQILIDYQMEESNQRRTLLPQNATVTVLDVDGKEYLDNTVYSHCRTFATESRFADGSEQFRGTFAKYEAHRGTIPAHKELRIALLTPLQVQHARIGEEIEARLEAPVRVAGGVQINAGATITGRVRQIKLLDDLPDTYSIGLQFDELTSSDTSYSFLAKLIAVEPLAGLSRTLSSASESTTQSITGALLHIQTSTRLPDPLAGASSFFLTGQHLLPAGFRMTWETLDQTYSKNRH